MDRDLDLLRTAADAALAYAAEIDRRRVAPSADAVDALEQFDEPLPDDGLDAGATLELLDRVGSPATMATTGPRYFGFVNGAVLPAALGAAFITSAWDQNAALPVMSPVAATIHRVVREWLIDLFGLDSGTDVAFVTGATVANACGIAAGRDALLDDLGWNVQADGLFGAPELPVVIGDDAHSTLRKSLGLVGLGRERVILVPTDDQGRMLPEQLPDIDGPALVCAQAGEVNTGAFDPFEPIADWVEARRGWLHVDGAFGLWALADPTRADLVRGLVRADSLATDGHKWLNVTYDCGICFVQRPGALRRTFTATAGYLPSDSEFEAMHHTPQSSQRARQFEVWAVLRTLGRSGVAELVQRASAVAAAIAGRLAQHGFEVLNEVVLNQVLVRPTAPVTTAALIAEIQSDGRVWCGPTTWRGEPAMRISVSGWKTTIDDGLDGADAIIECAARLRD
jgi:glutamate/tyrosine decarboxylase-like PLP-dependent enzyme